MYCEDYPCCGHTPQDPCDYDPRAYGERISKHAFCDHEFGFCEVDNRYEDDDDFGYEDDEPEDDSWDDADSLVSIGWGTDEDYGYYGE